MRKDLRILLLLMGFVVTMSGYGQVDAAPQELTEFAYNRAVAVTHARAALEDFAALMMPQQQLSEFDFSRPSVAAVLAKDCAGKEINVTIYQKGLKVFAPKQLEVKPPKEKENIFKNLISVNMFCIHKDMNIEVTHKEEILDSSFHPMKK